MSGVGLDPDAAMVERLERAFRGIEPDPLFRRRLRAVVVNRYVAGPEGMGHHGSATPARRMGSLGRSALYASLAVALGTSAAGAASQDSLPGDALYGVKLRLEEIRMQVAPPSLRDDLAALVLAERVEELELLTAAGRWHLVPVAAAHVHRAEAVLNTLGPAADVRERRAEAVRRAGEALQRAMGRAPGAARPGLERALQAVRGGTALERRHVPDPRPPDPGPPDRGDAGPPIEPPRRGSSANRTDRGSLPSATPRATATPSPSPTPTPTPAPTPPPSDDPTPRPGHGNDKDKEQD
ncbi:MAG TPA: hypothetical protein VHK63_06795 [Candidatus Limnocylindria bacterium]|nr:hypothetical protein [Candidatus Limnocylindria bacterium]